MFRNWVISDFSLNFMLYRFWEIFFAICAPVLRPTCISTPFMNLTGSAWGTYFNDSWHGFPLAISPIFWNINKNLIPAMVRKADPHFPVVKFGYAFLVVQRYVTGVLKHLNVRRFLSVHFESVIPASLAGVFLHSTPLSSLYFNPPCPLQKLKCVQ